MKPSPFEYASPETIEEAVDLKAEHGDEALFLAGGQSLIPLLALRLAHPAVLIDLNRVRDLDHIRWDDGSLVIGAMTRLRTVEQLPALVDRLSLVADAVPLIGHRAIRNRGTVGGSLVHADPAAEWPALAMALGGTVDVLGPRGPRVLAAAEFLRMAYTTSLEPDEVLREVRLPVPEPRTGSAFVEFARRHGDFALAGAAVILRFGPADRVSEASIALLGVAGTPIRVPEAEHALVDGPADDRSIEDAVAACRGAIDPPHDIHGSAAYRRHLAGVVAGRALRLARDRAEARAA